MPRRYDLEEQLRILLRIPPNATRVVLTLDLGKPPTLVINTTQGDHLPLTDSVLGTLAETFELVPKKIC